MSPDDESLEELLLARIQTAQLLDEKLQNPKYAKVGGVSKLRNRISSELKFLNSIAAGNPPLEKKYIETSNVTHFENIVSGMERYDGVTAVFNTFSLLDKNDQKTLKHTVDLVCNEGRRWVKVTSRSARGIAMDWLTGNTRNIFEQAESYMEMAALFPRNFCPPEVVFEFICGVPDRMAARLRSMGLTVIGEEGAFGIDFPKGNPEKSSFGMDFLETFQCLEKTKNTIPLESIVKVPPEYLEELEDGLEDDAEEGQNPDDAELPPVNLDVSAVFVLVTNLTHPGGTEHRFESNLLRQQAIMERKTAAREQLLRQITGRKWIICRTAHESVCNIVSTVAGPTERQRVDELWKQVEIVEDCMSERTAQLNESDRINGRSMMIFGSGDYHRAVTATANKHFVSSAYHQGVCFDVILHESRALSEQKERPLDG